MALDLISRFVKNKAKENPPVICSTEDLESLKEFVQNVAFGIDGIEANDPDKEVDINAAKGTVIQYWKNFTAGWQLDHEPISPKLVRQIRLVCLFYIT